MTPRHPPRRHLATVALEDYFQVGSFNRLIQRGQWYRFETRLERNTRRALDLLDQSGTRATFFVLGWVADQFPELVREVVERGHEVASKGYYHRGIGQMTPEEFREDLARAREALELATRTRVLGYRVAHEWFTPGDLWALEVLAREGYAYDSSIAPMLRQFARQPWRRELHRNTFDDKQLWEVPLSACNLFGLDVPIAGGNYFRQFPQRLVKRAIAAWDRRREVPFVLYFHVWELDPEQPQVNAASFLTRLRHYRNLDKMEGLLADYLGRYSFTSVADYLDLDTRLAPERLAACEERARERAAVSLRVLTPEQGEITSATRQDVFAPSGRVPATVVIPCFNEEPAIPYLARTLQSVRDRLGAQYDLRFLFVDDGSADATWHSLWKTFGGWPGCRVVRHERNRGVAAAVQTGLREADTEIVCTIDADCTYDPHELANMIPLMTADVDAVTASPYHALGQVRNVPKWRLGLSAGCSFLYRRVLHQKLATFTSCFRVYRRSAVVGLPVQHSGYLGIAELLARLDLNGGRIVEHPATLEVRLLGRSKMKTVKTILGHLKLLSRLLIYRLTSPAPTVRVERGTSATAAVAYAAGSDSLPNPERTTA